MVGGYQTKLRTRYVLEKANQVTLQVMAIEYGGGSLGDSDGFPSVSAIQVPMGNRRS